MTCVSSLYPSAKSGRIERSMKRLTRTSRSARRPSRLKKPPGILPDAANFSTKSTVSGEEIDSRSRGRMHGRHEDDGVTEGDGDRAGRLLGDLAGLDLHLAAADIDGHGRRFEPIRHVLTYSLVCAKAPSPSSFSSWRSKAHAVDGLETIASSLDATRGTTYPRSTSGFPEEPRIRDHPCANGLGACRIAAPFAYDRLPHHGVVQRTANSPSARRRRMSRRRRKSTPEAEFLDQGAVAIHVLVLQVIEQTAALADDLEGDRGASGGPSRWS